MKKGSWKKRIEKACRDAGTYEPYFDDLIDTLAQIMENRDEAQKEYKRDGCRPVIAQDMTTGIVKMVKNPILLMVNDLNAAALAYWRDLGLTPKGFTAMQKGGFEKKEASFEELLKDIGI